MFCGSISRCRQVTEAGLERYALFLERMNLAPPDVGTDPDEAPKNAGEVRLVAHAAVECDPGKRLLGACHDRLGAQHALTRDVSQGTRTETNLERSGEVTDAEPRESGELNDADL